MRKRVLCHMRTTKTQTSLRNLINAFVFHCLDSVMSLVSVTKISSLMLASVAEQASLSLTWSETPKDTFSHAEAHMVKSNQSLHPSDFVLTIMKNQNLKVILRAINISSVFGISDG